jgi:hypothetical protein
MPDPSTRSSDRGWLLVMTRNLKGACAVITNVLISEPSHRLGPNWSELGTVCNGLCNGVVTVMVRCRSR